MASELSSPNYKLQFGDFAVTSGTKSSETYQLRDIVGQTANSIYSDSGYILKAGWLNLTEKEAFGMTIDPNAIRFAPLYPDQPIEKELKISVVIGGASSFQVLAAELDLLKSSQGNTVANTSCDDSLKSCTVDQAATWTSSLTHGFGYRVKGADAPEDFSRSDAFRPFATLSLGQSPAVLLQSNISKSPHNNIIYLKINIGEEQPSGVYQNQIQFTAIPGY